MDDVRCDGTEEALVNCQHTSYHNCDHTEDAGVKCIINSTSTSDCTYGSIHLVGGSNATEGRVEVCINGVWGTVCDDFWGPPDAAVVCRQLGIDGDSIARTNAYFGAGTGPINMDNVQCTGNEGFLVNCTYLSIHNCFNSEDAGVSCGIQPSCNYSDIRLVGGSNDNEGRVEVCLFGSWSTVCDDSWGPPHAAVVCRQLGINGSSIAYAEAYFGAGTGPINMGNVQCTGNEELLISCRFSSNHYCSHSSDAGVACGATPRCNYSDIHLVGGSNDNEGRVEVCINGAWGTVCDDSWDNDDAVVVCSQLGIDGVAVARTNAYFGAGTGPINMDNVQCTGNERLLVNCTYLSTHDCGHSEDAGVTCGATPQCNDTDIRLANGSNDNEGRVEMCIDDRWLTLCSSTWTVYEAALVCKQLGINGVSVPRSSTYFSSSTVPSDHLVHLFCAGNEDNFTQCTTGLIPYWLCVHFYGSFNVGVTCDAQPECNNTDIRLVGGSNDNEGRVEVCSNGTWGTICGSSWDNDDAIVVCRQLGLESTGIHKIGYFGSGSSSIVMANVQCNGTEDLLVNLYWK
ncbi:PREDICTED: deleted in malignant brain tumors 1 protein-like [Amphimedon queenslandica]|uniref:SRCR domain-containing protein n=1 Tax=Amphimedon queenslandica TaxID=400682 RepID=A0AAN0JT58_AMPQE|nr:PREDICTED: deleted in malignant brain tumors 1 protein-like [Amphimedon queenslandica]|eukprot:XP_019860060.1 PREDICTED: deleted in malignant brain tumors 1 protein-like [Amphimedon queenslandica]